MCRKETTIQIMVDFSFLSFLKSGDDSAGGGVVFVRYKKNHARTCIIAKK